MRNVSDKSCRENQNTHSMLIQVVRIHVCYMFRLFLRSSWCMSKEKSYKGR